MVSPTERTLKWLRDAGWTAEVVERWNPHSKTRHDLFGFADILAIHADHGILAVQATSGGNTAAREAKIEAEPKAETWMDAGGGVIVVGWRRLVAYRKDGSKAKRPRWACKVRQATRVGDGIVFFNPSMKGLGDYE